MVLWQLFKVSGPWAQRRRRSVGAVIVIACFILVDLRKSNSRIMSQILLAESLVSNCRNVHYFLEDKTHAST